MSLGLCFRCLVMAYTATDIVNIRADINSLRIQSYELSLKMADINTTLTRLEYFINHFEDNASDENDLPF